MLKLPKANNKQLFAKWEANLFEQMQILLANAKMPIAGQFMSTRQVTGALRSHLEAMKSVDDLNAAHAAAVKAENAMRAALKPILIGVGNFAAGMFGEDSKEFKALGFSSRKAPAKTARSKADAVDKSRATRKARGTMGKRQRAQLHASNGSGANGSSPR